MKTRPGVRCRGFTLIELLVALLILSSLALMSYRGLGAVLDAREHVARETEKWRHVAAFLARFERDVQLAAPRSVRGRSAAAAWRGQSDPRQDLVEFSRFASIGGADTPRRLGYRLNDSQEIELLLWPGLDVAPEAVPARYAVLKGVQEFELQYLNIDLAWAGNWPLSPRSPVFPLAVRLRLRLASGEELTRVFALGT